LARAAEISPIDILANVTKLPSEISYETAAATLLQGIIVPAAIFPAAASSALSPLGMIALALTTDAYAVKSGDVVLIHVPIQSSNNLANLIFI
jgi:hypothetical protein